LCGLAAWVGDIIFLLMISRTLESRLTCKKTNPKLKG
jgi:hypothetical protein